MGLSRTHELDEIDWSIVEALQRDGRLSFRELARQVHLSPAAATARVHLLESEGVIAGYTARIDRARIGCGIEAFVRVSTTTTTSRSIGTIEKLTEGRPGVVSVHQVLGDCDLIIHVALPDLETLDALVNEFGVYGQTTTMIVSSTPIRDAPLDRTIDDATTDSPSQEP